MEQQSLQFKNNTLSGYLLAIDAGTTKSGWVIIDTDLNVLHKGITKNDELLEMIPFMNVSIFALEMIASYGMAVGKTTFDTVLFIGRLQERIRACHFTEAVLITRVKVKMHLCHSMRAKDKNIAQAIKDKYDPIGGGKDPYKGTKSQPGHLYGVSSHMWSALAVAISVHEGAEHYQVTKDLT